VREWRVIYKWIVRNYDIFMYVCSHARTCVCMYYVCTCVCVCVNVYTEVCVFMYVCNVHMYCVCMCVCILIIKPTRCTISQIYFGIEFYMFRTGLLSIIRCLVLYTR